MRILLAMAFLVMAAGFTARYQAAPQGAQRGLTFYGTPVYEIQCEGEVRCDMSNNILRISTEYYGQGVEPACARKRSQKVPALDANGHKHDETITTNDVGPCKQIQQELRDERAKEKKEKQ